MAQQFTDEMRIALFPNDKGGNEKRPDWRGTIQIDGIKYRVSLWDKNGPKGPYKAGQIELDKTQGTQSHQSAPQTETRAFIKPQPTDAQLANQGGPTDGGDVPF